MPVESLAQQDLAAIPGEHIERKGQLRADAEGGQDREREDRQGAAGEQFRHEDQREGGAA
ncbi:hypothetical protein D3C72_2485860 [compost metagenome]